DSSARPYPDARLVVQAARDERRPKRADRVHHAGHPEERWPTDAAAPRAAAGTDPTPREIELFPLRGPRRVIDLADAQGSHVRDLPFPHMVVNVSLGARSYAIVVESGALTTVGVRLRALGVGSRAALVPAAP